MRNVWRKFLAWLKSLKSSDDEPTNPQPDPVEPDPVPNPTGELIDPPGFSMEWVREHAESEELGMEQDHGIRIRNRVWYPGAKRWPILSTPFVGHVRNVQGGKQVDTPFSPTQGGVYVLRGWCKQSPSNNSDPNPKLDETGSVSKLDVAMWECRGAS